MLGIHDLPLFVMSGLLLNITPGADSLYIATRSATQGLKAGVAAALGIGAGCFVHILAAALPASRRAGSWPRGGDAHPAHICPSFLANVLDPRCVSRLASRYSV